MIYIKNAAQIEKMRDAGKLLYDVMQRIREVIIPGETTAAIDAFAEEIIRRNHAIPSFLNYHGYPNSICASVDDEVVHGIPSDSKVLKPGSLVSIDCGLILDGWQADSAFTVGIGEIPQEHMKLIRTTEASFFAGARQALANGRLGDIGHAVQTLAESEGYGVVRALTGHGIGRNMHEDPSVPNFGEAGKGTRLRAGMTLAIEPMITLGDWHVVEMEDGWTIKTKDHLPCSHYEHTILILPEGPPEILTLPGFSWDSYSAGLDGVQA